MQLNELLFSTGPVPRCYLVGIPAGVTLTVKHKSFPKLFHDFVEDGADPELSTPKSSGYKTYASTPLLDSLAPKGAREQEFRFAHSRSSLALGATRWPEKLKSFFA